MSAVDAPSRSLRTVRLRARAPQALAVALVAILCAAGLRATLAPRRPAPPAPVAAAPTDDPGAAAFAEGFARAYLTWDPDDTAAHGRALAPYLGGGLDADAGVRPSGRAQTVAWTAVLGTRRSGRTRLVTLAVQTSRALVYLSVPVTRDARGLLSVSGYPALVGPPAVDHATAAPSGPAVEDKALADVVTRALTNYLSANRPNLLADLSPDAVVSLPATPLRLTRVADLTWLTTGGRVAVVLDATDPDGTSWTLRYELDVLHRERWYVRSLQVDPTFPGGS